MSNNRELPDDDAEIPDEVGKVLENLADSGGAAVEKLASEAGRPLLDYAKTPLQWSRRQQATAVHNVINDLIETLGDNRHRHAVRTRLGMAGPPGADGTILSPLEAFVHKTSVPPQTRGNSADGSGVQLAPFGKIVFDRLAQINATRGWESHIEDQAARPEQLPDHPFEFDSYHMVFTLRGRAGVECTTYRVLRALQDGIDSYPSVGWYFSDPGSPVEIDALANCRVTGLTRRPDGGVAAKLKLPHPLRKGESCFFASRIRYASEVEANRVITHEVRSRRVRRLTIGVQFDVAALPEPIWRFSGDTLNTEPPASGSDAFLAVSELGYVEHIFENCEHGRKIGLQWNWSHHSAPARQAGRSQHLRPADQPGRSQQAAAPAQTNPAVPTIDGDDPAGPAKEAAMGDG